ncbi:SURF1 family protein [Streptomyces aidingensis]|uniref:SURF1-like protein n=1 Tax=Streptomyces aidingensis TaxID=910347 RepID=A0A1I1M1Q3_9ACTN|nr:SURF1 family protein [Streptomyces aidingensis]SFC78682.1 Cytochrome oxidase assembly protein ShyY1 [Streptomyces aidingensis]
MYRFLLSRQWVLLTLVALLLIPLMVLAGFWQMGRHEQRVARNDLIAASLAAGPVEMAELTAPGRGPDDADRYRPVTATGRYLPADEVVVRHRKGPGAGGGAIGYFVVTPLIQADGTAVLVNRGWVPAGDDPTRLPEVPAPPAGEVTVTGRLMADESTGSSGRRERSGLPAGMVMLISSGQRAEEMGIPVLGGHLELTATEPAPPADPAQPALLDEPDHSGIGAHFAYALQWWFFAAMVPVGWVLLARREAAERAAAAARPRPEADDAAARPAATPAGATPPA